MSIISTRSRDYAHRAGPAEATPREASGLSLAWALLLSLTCLWPWDAQSNLACADENPRRSATDLIVERVSREMSSWNTLELQSTHTYDFKLGRNDAGRAERIENTVIVTADRKHVYEAFMHCEGGRVGHFLAADDGFEHAEVSFDMVGDGRANTITVQATRTSINQPVYYDILLPRGFRDLYINEIPLHAKLKAAEYLGPVVVGGRPCESFRLRDVRRLGKRLADVVYCFDRLSGMPVKISFEYLRQNGKRLGLNEWQVLSLERREGHYFPIRSKTSNYYYDKAGARVHDWTITSTYKKIKFNGSCAPERFRPDRPPGVTIVDKLRRRVYIVPGSRADATAGVGRS